MWNKCIFFPFRVFSFIMNHPSFLCNKILILFGRLKTEKNTFLLSLEREKIKHIIVIRYEKRVKFDNKCPTYTFVHTCVLFYT